MRCRVERQRIAAPLHHVGLCAHRTGDKAELTITGFNRALPGNDQVLPVVVFPLHEVVMTIDLFGLLNGRTHEAFKRVKRLNHHFFTVQIREPLRPLHGVHVLLKLTRTFHQIGKIAVNINEVSTAILHRKIHEVSGDLIADPTRTRMQERPHAIIFVSHNLNEVIATAERAQLVFPRRREIFRPPPLKVKIPLTPKFIQEISSRLRQGFGVLPRAHRNARFNVFPKVTERTTGAHLILSPLSTNRDHAATQIHTHSRRNHRAPRRNDRPHSRALTQMGIRHQGHMRFNKRHPRNAFHLIQGFLIDLRSPRIEFLANAFHCFVLTLILTPGTFPSPGKSCVQSFSGFTHLTIRASFVSTPDCSSASPIHL